MRIAERSKRVEKSETLRVKEKALVLKQQGVDVVDLTAGEPDFPTPPNVCEAGIHAISNGFTRYTANAGIPELRQAIMDKFKKDNNLAYQTDQVIVSAGAKQAITNAVLTLVEKGDEAIIIAPYWVSYIQQIRLANATPVVIDSSKTNFKLTSQDLEAHITPKTRMLLFNSPSNPCGIVYSPDELAELAEVLRKHDIWIISDEIYEKILFDDCVHKSFAQFPDLFEKTIVVNGVSKSYSMTGWRIGYSAGPGEVIKGMAKIQSHYATPPSISQKAALEAISGDQGYIEKMRQTFEERRNKLVNKLKDFPEIKYAYPQGAFYFFLDISPAFGKKWNGKTIENSLDFSEYLIESQHLVTVPGMGFGAPDFIRLSFAASEKELEEGFNRLFATLKSWEAQGGTN